MFGPGVASACHEGHPGYAGRPYVKHRSWAVGSWPWEAGLLNLKTLVNATVLSAAITGPVRHEGIWVARQVKKRPGSVRPPWGPRAPDLLDRWCSGRGDVGLGCGLPSGSVFGIRNCLFAPWLRPTFPLGRETFLCLSDTSPNSRLTGRWPRGVRETVLWLRGGGVALPRGPLTPPCPARLGVRGHALHPPRTGHTVVTPLCPDALCLDWGGRGACRTFLVTWGVEGLQRSRHGR